MFKKLSTICHSLTTQFELITDERKGMLQLLSYYIKNKYEEDQVPKLIVICSHNSRRSHIAQLWLSIAADYFNLPKLETYSGGTEVTEFNIRAVKALERIGIDVETNERNEPNPKYEIKWKEAMEPYIVFSKKYEHKSNPQEKFSAILVCSQANDQCPIVFGSEFKISIPFSDPKDFDDTEIEELIYDSRVKQIGREMLFILSEVRKEIKVKTLERIN